MKRLLIAFAPLALAACMPQYDGIQIEMISSPPVPQIVRNDEIELDAGLAVAVYAEPLSSNNQEYEDPGAFRLESEDESVLRVELRDESYQFVLVAEAAGETCVRVRIDGNTEECIPARVSGQ